MFIRNFKSLREVTLNLRRINVLIGPPNSGKSNIIDAMAILSGVRDIYKYARFRAPVDLVYQQERSREIMISLDDNVIKGVFKDWSLNLYFGNRHYWSISSPKHYNKIIDIDLGIMVYRFWEDRFGSLESPPLKPPTGENLLGVMLSDTELRKFVGATLQL